MDIQKVSSDRLSMINEKISDKEKLAQLRHSAAHLLAHAVSELYPATKLTIGPATDEGFFYDLLPEHNFKEEDLPLIQARMVEIAHRNLPLTHTQVPKAEGKKLYAQNPFKLELIDAIPEDTVGIATQGNFNDLCRGGHVASTSMIKHFKLLSISGSYWRADRNGQALQRITGTAFWTQQELDAYLKRREELEMYDHRRLGKQLDLFSFHEEGVGFPFFHPKGKRVINVMTSYMRKLQDEYNYQEISTPTMLSEKLWHQSGHYAHYKDNMYFSSIDEQTYAIKPMNCPGSILVYKTRPRSFRELPLKLSEFGHVHRHELSGVLHGLIRVRAFTQDDAHIYCTPEQIEEQILTIITMIKTMLTKFGFDSYKFAISTKPAKAMGSPELWEQAITALKSALTKANVQFTIKEGEGAFYGPKIEVGIQDSMGREWQCGTAQVDFFQPENFDLSYVASGGAKERPVIIHQANFGSLERFFAITLEHHKGALPFWLSPIQATILTITDAQKEYGQKIMDALKATGIRVIMDESSDPISGKIKAAQIEKIPWMLVLGAKEVEASTITLRYLNGKQEFGLSLEALIKKAQES
jgi:threonyl-tRNA synthetase